MKKILSHKKFIIIAAAFALIIGSAIAVNQVDAASKKRCTRSCSFVASKAGYTYSVVTTANYPCRPWPSWGCSLLQSEALARLSPGTLSGSWGLGCGNIHSYVAYIIGTPPPQGPSTGQITGGNGGGNNTGTSTLQRECTPGIDCPADDLGKIITDISLNPGFARSSDNKCPLFWTTGQERPEQDRGISCQIITNGSSTDIFANQKERYPQGYLVPVGKHTLVCMRGDDEKMEQVLECKPNPSVIER